MNQRDIAKGIDRSALDSLAAAIARHAPRAGDHPTALAALSLHRRHAPTDPLPCIYPLGLALTSQGEKQVMLKDEVLGYVPGQSLLATIDLPVVAHVTKASPAAPYLGLMLRLDALAIASVASEMALPPPEPDHVHAPISIETLEPALLGALERLVALLDEPALLPNLAPLIEREILVRLLAGPHGPHLQQLVLHDSPNQRIARVVTWMKQHFTHAVGVDALAAKANMSASTFRKHFLGVTGMSPLQYQKQLRLQEARQLMLNRGIEAGRAANLVGYLSESQFSREYHRVFGAPPQRDVKQIRAL